MTQIRSHLPSKVAQSNEVRNYANGEQISVAGLVIRRQRPSSKTIFLTLEDEFGHSPLLIWARDYKRLKPLIKHSLILATGNVSRREGTMNIIVQTIIPIPKSSQIRSKIFPNSSRTHPKVISKSFQNHPKIVLKSSQNIPKSSKPHPKIIPNSF